MNIHLNSTRMYNLYCIFLYIKFITMQSSETLMKAQNF